MTDRVPHRGLDAQGIATGAEIFWNLTTAPLVEHAVRRGEGLLAKDGPLVVRTGKFTGRAAKDKYIVRNSVTEDTVWWGRVNQPMDPDAFDRLHDDFLLALADKDVLFVADLYGGSQPEHRVRVRAITELAWHSLFARTLLVRPEPHELAGFEPKLLGREFMLAGGTEIHRHFDRRLPGEVARGKRRSRSNAQRDGGTKREAERDHCVLPGKSHVETMGSLLVQMRMNCNCDHASDPAAKCASGV